MLEEEEGLKDLVKYVVFSDKGGSWRVQAVPIGSGSFKNRLDLCVCILCGCFTFKQLCTILVM